MKYVLMMMFCTLAAISWARSSVFSATEFRKGPASWNKDIQTPEEFLGFSLGEHHVQNAQIHQYMQSVAKASDRVSYDVIGQTHESKPLGLAIITSPRNHKQLDQILRIRENGDSEAQEKTPIVVFGVYSIHGNEASGSNAALEIVYQLAAGVDPGIDELLDKVVFLLHPSANPDGLDRYAAWVNPLKGFVPLYDSRDEEHQEVWPGGRTNHYWFDLNRDWLLLQQPESKARLKILHSWHPHVLLDFHEMGVEHTYFFQPGVPSRGNPKISSQNQEVTGLLTGYVAQALDSASESYYTKEDFDDFYIGKGSTYPDVTNGIGILFEQGSVRGHHNKNIDGKRSFIDAIQNQIVSTMAMLSGVVSEEKRVRKVQSEVMHEFKPNAKDPGAFVYCSDNKSRLNEFHSYLKMHEINTYRLLRKVAMLPKSPDGCYIIPVGQRHPNLILAMFQSQTKFTDSQFYDVSAWNLFHAYDFPYATLDWQIRMSSYLGQKIDVQESDAFAAAIKIPEDAQYGVLSWREDNTIKGVSALLANEVAVKFATKASSFSNGNKISAGDIIINVPKSKTLRQSLEEILTKRKLEPTWLSTGLASKGVDMGSRSVLRIREVKAIMAIGSGVGDNEAGDIWYFMDHWLGLPLTKVRTERIEKIRLADYTHLLLPNGKYEFSEKFQSRIIQWVEAGGVLIEFSEAIKWQKDLSLSKLKLLDEDAAPSQKTYTYRQRESFVPEQRIAGTIMGVTVDSTHPLGFGYDSKQTFLLKDTQAALETEDNPFIHAVRYKSEPVVAGYASKVQSARIQSKSALAAYKLGSGTVISFADNPVFRGYWKAGHRLLANAIYFGSEIEKEPDFKKKKGEEKPNTPSL